MGKRLQSSDHIRTAFRLAEDGKYRIAERKQRQALRAARRTGGRDLVWALYAAGVFFRKHKRLENAIQALSECWELASQAQFDDAIEIAENSASLRAMCCADNGDLGTAKSWYLRARSAAEAGGKCANIARLDLLLAAYDVQLKNVKSAVKRYEQALLCDEIEPQHRRMAEELLVILYGRRKQPEKREALRAKLIQQSIGDFISQPRTAKVPDKMAHPAGFGTDTLSDFLFAAEMSTLATYEQKESLFRRLVEKDAHFRVMGRAVMNFVSNQFNKQYPQLAVHEIQPTDADWLEVYFFQQCHSSYLAAVRLAASGQNPPAQMVLRGCLENAMYAYLVFRRPQDKHVWLNRASEPETVRDRFTASQVWKQMDHHDPQLRKRIEPLYDRTIDEGAHPNVNAMKRHFSHEHNFKRFQATLSYLDPPNIEHSLNEVLEVVEGALVIFDLVFDSAD
jgi:hypothetical protein